MTARTSLNAAVVIGVLLVVVGGGYLLVEVTDVEYNYEVENRGLVGMATDHVEPFENVPEKYEKMYRPFDRDNTLKRTTVTMDDRLRSTCRPDHPGRCIGQVPVTVDGYVYWTSFEVTEVGSERLPRTPTSGVAAIVLIVGVWVATRGPRR